MRDELMNAEIAHVAERHRRAGGVLGFACMASHHQGFAGSSDAVEDVDKHPVVHYMICE